MAERTEIAGELNALAVHCRPPIMEVAQRASWLRDWCNDLAEFDIEAIRAACREWRHSEAVKFPTPGQFVPLVRKRLPDERPRQDSAPWRPISDAEYAELSLPDKIRHHKILAHEAETKCGPMWKNTSHITGKPSGYAIEPADMLPTWRHWNDIATGHHREAKRLRQYLKPQAVAAE